MVQGTKRYQHSHGHAWKWILYYQAFKQWQASLEPSLGDHGESCTQVPVYRDCVLCLSLAAVLFGVDFILYNV